VRGTSPGEGPFVHAARVDLADGHAMWGRDLELVAPVPQVSGAVALGDDGVLLVGTAGEADCWIALVDRWGELVGERRPEDNGMARRCLYAGVRDGDLLLFGPEEVFVDPFLRTVVLPADDPLGGVPVSPPLVEADGLEVHGAALLPQGLFVVGGAGADRQLWLGRATVDGRWACD